MTSTSSVPPNPISSLEELDMAIYKRGSLTLKSEDDIIDLMLDTGTDIIDATKLIGIYFHELAKKAIPVNLN